MADDTRGFQRFELRDNFEFYISNERAWDAPGVNKPFAGNGAPAFAGPGNARDTIVEILGERLPIDQNLEDGEFAYTTEILVDDIF